MSPSRSARASWSPASARCCAASGRRWRPNGSATTTSRWTSARTGSGARGRPVSLGPTEFRLLKHFLENPGRVFSRERLLDAVWSHDPDIDLRTVDVHVRRLRKAINDGGRPDIIRTVRSAGYSLDAEG